MDHVLLTRFNLPTVGQESIVRAKEGWLTKRWALFTRYCLPSVENQTATNFSWLIYLDPESPNWLLEEMRLIGERGTAHPLLRFSVSAEELSSDIDRVTGRRSGRLATTNLDNDDALAPDFLARVQAVECPGPTVAYLVNGLIKTPTGLYRHTDRVNAFCSVIDDGPHAKTCWLDWHNLLPNHMPAVYVDGAPAWLQVVHGTNVSNRLHGRLADPAQYLSTFPEMLDDLDSPGFTRLQVDRFAFGPGREAKESVRRAAKHALEHLGGKDALERVRLARAKLRQLNRIQ